MVLVFSLTEEFYPLADGINVTGPTSRPPFGPTRCVYWNGPEGTIALFRCTRMILYPR